MDWKLYKRPFYWGLIYMGAIIIFATLYMLVPQSEWGGCERNSGFLDSVYFSVVTITSLGFGDSYLSSGSPYRLLVILESIAGILIIGFFLNDIAISQSKHLDEQNKQKEENMRHQDALARLRKHFTVITPAILRYLRSVYEVVTPISCRSKTFPHDIMAYPFDFEMKDISDLYKQSLLMTSGFKEPAIDVYFKNQDALYDEIRTIATSADLSDWPELLAELFHFITLHQEFQFKDAILSNKYTYLGTGADGRKFSDVISEEIKNHDGNLKFRSSNIMTPYEVLFVSLKQNIEAVKKIFLLMKESSYAN